MLKKIPIFGSLAYTRIQDHSAATWELFVCISLSSIPIWLGSVILKAFDTTDKSVLDFAVDTMKTGELFLLSTSFIAPLFYFVLKEYNTGARFPHQSGLIISSLLVFLVCVAFFAVIRAGGINTQAIRINSDFVFNVSIGILIFSITLTYVAHVYKNLHETGAAHHLRSDTHSFVDKYKRK